MKEEWNVKGEAEFIAKFSDRLSNSIQIDSPLHCNFLKDRLKGRQAKQFRPILWITLISLKGQCLEIFSNFFLSKKSTWAPYEQTKTVLQTFSFLQSYSQKFAKKVGVLEVVDFVDMVSAWSLTMPTQGQRGC